MKHRIEPSFQVTGLHEEKLGASSTRVIQQQNIDDFSDNSSYLSSDIKKSKIKNVFSYGARIYSIQVLLVLGFIIQVAVLCVLLLSLANYAQTKNTNQLTGELRKVILKDIHQVVSSFVASPPRSSYLAAKVLERIAMNDYDISSKAMWDIKLGTDDCLATYIIGVAGTSVGFIGTPPTTKLTVWPTIAPDVLFLDPYLNTTDGTTPLPTLALPHVPFNGRNEVWFKEIVAGKEHYWLPAFLDPLHPSTLFITSLRPVYNRTNHEVEAVIGMSFSVERLAQFMQNELAIGKTGVSYVIERSGMIIATSSAKTPFYLSNNATGFQTRVHIQDSPDKLISESAQVLIKKQGGSLDHMVMDNDHHSITYESPTLGKVSMKYTTFVDIRGIYWIIVVAIPDSDYNQAVRQTRLIIIYVSLGVAVISIVLSVAFSIFITYPLRRLGTEMEKIAQMELEPAGEKKKSYSYKTLYEVQQLQNQFNKMKGALKYFGRYVPVEVVRILLKENSGESSSLSLRSGNVAVLFSDIVSFTSLSEQLSADILLSMLEQYFNDLSTIILQHEGTLDKYIGDSIMAFWGMPSPVHNYIHKCVRSAVMMQKRLSQLEEEWLCKGLPAFKTRIGLNCGPALVGNIGSPMTRVSYTALGDTVNLASRLEALNKYYGSNILITEKIYNEVHEEFLCRPLDRVTVVGKKASTNIYEVVDFLEDATAEQVIRCQEYQEAYELYTACQFRDAREKFEEYHNNYPDDSFVEIMIVRCHEYETNPPVNWDGSFRHTAK